MTALSLADVAHAVCSRDGFEFVAEVGEGSFKATFHVRRGNNESVALKVYKPGSSTLRTEREIDALTRCAHEGIARLHAIGSIEFNSETYLLAIEEYIAGGTLSTRVSLAGLLGRDDVRNVGGSLIEAVAHIASHDLVHRDLKPDNILFRDAGNSPVIVDFGLVRNLSESSITQTWALQGPGTPYFAPPEQLTNDKDLIDWRSDQFSLGVALSISALGFHPYSEAGDTKPETVERVALRRGPAARFADAVRLAGLEVLTRMVAPWPVSRFRTPNDLRLAWRAL